MRKPVRGGDADARPDRTDAPADEAAGDVAVPVGGDAAPAGPPDDAAGPPPSAPAPGPAPVAADADADADATGGTPGPADEVPSDPADELRSDDALSAEVPSDDAPDPPPAGDVADQVDGAADLPACLPDGTPSEFPDDLLLDPLLCDEPIDLAAVRADDALIDALGVGDLDTAAGLVDPDDPLIAMLAAWAASARPDDPPTDRSRPPLTLVGENADPVADTAADAGDVSRTNGPEVADDDPALPDGAAASTSADAVGDLEPPTVRLDPGNSLATVVPLVGSRDGSARTAATPADTDPTGGSTDDDGGAEPAAATASAQTRTVGAALRLLPAPVVSALERAGISREGARPARPHSPGYPVRRAAVVTIMAALGVTAAAAAGGTAQPGDAGFPITRVLFAERARSLEAAEVVADGLQRARLYLDHRQPAMAAEELAAVDRALPDVREQEGHTRLTDRQEELAAAVAVTPQGPPDPSLPAPGGPESDTSTLAEGTPPDETTTPQASSDAESDSTPESEAETTPEKTTSAAAGGAPSSAGSSSGTGTTTGGSTAGTPSSSAAGAGGGTATSTTPPDTTAGTTSRVRDKPVPAPSSSSTPDSGTSGSGTPDSSTSDSSTPDSSTPDSSTSNSGTSNSGTADSGTADSTSTSSTTDESNAGDETTSSTAKKLSGSSAGRSTSPASSSVGTRASGSVTANSSDDDDAAPATSPAARHAGGTHATVPSPAQSDRPVGVAAEQSAAGPTDGKDDEAAPSPTAVAGARLSGAGEAATPAENGSGFNRGR